MIRTLADNNKSFISGLEIIFCLLQLNPFPDVTDRSCHIGEVLAASLEAPATLVTTMSQ